MSFYPRSLFTHHRRRDIIVRAGKKDRPGAIGKCGSENCSFSHIISKNPEKEAILGNVGTP